MRIFILKFYFIMIFKPQKGKGITTIFLVILLLSFNGRVKSIFNGNSDETGTSLQLRIIQRLFQGQRRNLLGDLFGDDDEDDDDEDSGIFAFIKRIIKKIFGIDDDDSETRPSPTSCSCSKAVNPVCGKNKKTYLNSCEAKCDKEDDFYNGPCLDKEQQDLIDQIIEQSKNLRKNLNSNDVVNVLDDISNNNLNDLLKNLPSNRNLNDFSDITNNIPDDISDLFHNNNNIPDNIPIPDNFDINNLPDDFNINDFDVNDLPDDFDINDVNLDNIDINNLPDNINLDDLRRFLP